MCSARNNTNRNGTPSAEETKYTEPEARWTTSKVMPPEGHATAVKETKQTKRRSKSRTSSKNNLVNSKTKCRSVFAKLQFLEQTLPRVVPLSRRTSLSGLIVDELLHRYLKVRHLGRGSSDHVFQGREGGGQTVDLRRKRADAPFYRTAKQKWYG